MKQLKRALPTASALIALLAVTGCDAPVPDTQNHPLIEPDHEYEIDTWGANSEVYEFTPRSNGDKTCVFLMLDSGAAMGLQCFDKSSDS